MQIIDLGTLGEDTIRRVALLLMEGFRDTGSPAWLTLESAVDEVTASLAPGKISRIAVADDGTVLGWIGGTPQYDGHAWELHPLVVATAHRGQGIGHALVVDFERLVKERGGTTVYLGTDDENNRTSLGGVELYPNVLEHVSRIRNLRRHPYEFYQKLGYHIVGVIPDANGWGKPDILMAKRVSTLPEDP
jgi:aminoglycoside 6'-N-acetyltransferase I